MTHSSTYRGGCPPKKNARSAGRLIQNNHIKFIIVAQCRYKGMKLSDTEKGTSGDSANALNVV